MVTENDIKIFNKIIYDTQMISSVYERLLYIEFMEDKNYCIYNGLLNELKRLIKEEKELYNTLNLKTSKKVDLLEYLEKSNKFNYNPEKNMFTSACNKNTKDLCIYRICNKLDEYSNLNNELIEQLKIEFDDDEELVNQFLKELKFRTAINDDFERAYVFFIQEEINKSTDVSMKDYLTKLRYNLSFITTNIEKELVENNFNNSNDFYFIFPFIGDRLNIDKEYQKNIEEDEIYNYSFTTIENIKEVLQLDDSMEDYKNKSIKVLSLYFRAGISILYAHDNYEEFIDNLGNGISEYEEVDKTNQIIEMCLEESKIDVVKCKYLSMCNPEK